MTRDRRWLRSQGQLPLRIGARCPAGRHVGKIRTGSLGGVSERFNVVVLKTTGRKPRGFESLPLRHHARSPRLR
jgi:hypothetical protein